MFGENGGELAVASPVRRRFILTPGRCAADARLQLPKFSQERGPKLGRDT
jgi:hypothetical protein